MIPHKTIGRSVAAPKWEIVCSSCFMWRRITKTDDEHMVSTNAARCPIVSSRMPGRSTIKVPTKQTNIVSQVDRVTFSFRNTIDISEIMTGMRKTSENASTIGNSVNAMMPAMMPTV